MMFAETKYNIGRLNLWCYKHTGLFAWPDQPNLMGKFDKFTRWPFHNNLYDVKPKTTFDLE